MGKDKNVSDVMKDKLCGDIIKESVGSCSKTRSNLKDDNKVGRKARRT